METVHVILVVSGPSPRPSLPTFLLTTSPRASPAPLTPMRVQADAAAAPLSAPAAAEAGWKVQMRQDDTAVRSNKHDSVSAGGGEWRDAQVRAARPALPALEGGHRADAVCRCRCSDCARSWMT